MAATCPYLSSAAASPSTNQDWFPTAVDVSVLNRKPQQGTPLGADFDYRAAFATLDLGAVAKDIEKVMHTSQPWWPADYGNYGPFFIRMAWHSAGTYRTADGRGGAGAGMQRLAPLNSWPDNGNLDKARRLLWPIKQKYGSKLSWADLMILAGTVALDSMGLKTIGFGGGREDAWEADDTDWGPERKWLGNERYQSGGHLANPLAAVQMGLIYVNPEGPNGNPDPALSAHDIRDTFARMSMNDEETVALIAGGHTFGKCHGAVDAKYVGPAPEEAALEDQGLGWRNSYGSGNGVVTMTSGLEGAWTTNPVQWDSNYFENLFGYEWEVYKSPAGAWQWRPADGAARDKVRDAHDPSRRHPPMMLTSDLALRVDPAYEQISRRFWKDPRAFADAFARAWFKLTHRDMGPRCRYVGSLVPSEAFLWQDPVPAAAGPAVGPADLSALSIKILASGLTTAQLVRTAWASASTFRGTDKRGGANGARIRLAPQNSWAVNEPNELAKVLAVLERIRGEHNAGSGAKVSLADLIVYAGCVAVEAAASKAGTPVAVPFCPGRTDATEEQTDAASFAVLEPAIDGFRNYPAAIGDRRAEVALVERARLLTLTAAELTVLVGGLRVLGCNAEGATHGVLTARPGVLSPDFFTNLLDMRTQWCPLPGAPGLYEGRCRASGEARWTATRVDLFLGSSSQLRAIAEVYASEGAGAKFAADFAAAWSKVMNLDRFDIK